MVLIYQWSYMIVVLVVEVERAKMLHGDRGKAIEVGQACRTVRDFR